MLAMRTRSRPQRIVSPSWTEGDKHKAAAARTSGMAATFIAMGHGLRGAAGKRGKVGARQRSPRKTARRKQVVGHSG